MRAALLFLLLALNKLDAVAADNLEDMEGLVQNRDVSVRKDYTHNMTSKNADKVYSVTNVPNDWFTKLFYSYMPNMIPEFVQPVSEAIVSYIKDTLHSYITDFAKKVRSVLHEEIYKLLDSMWKALSHPDYICTLWGKIPKEAADTIMTIGLIIICLILNYIFWQLHLSILFVLAFDASILLMYKTWGPVWVYSNIWCLIHCTWSLVSFVWVYQNISLFVIVIFYILGLIIPIVRYLIITIQSWVAGCKRKQKLDPISMKLSRLEERLADGVQSIQVSIAVLAEEVQQLKTTVQSHNCTLTNGVQGLRATVDEIHLNTGSINALTGEVKQVKATVDDIRSRNGSITTLANEVQQLKATMNEVHSRSGSIATLMDEVQQLKTTVNEVHTMNGSTADEVGQLNVKMNEIHSINATLIKAMQQLKATSVPTHVARRSTVNQGDELSSHSCNTEQSSPRQCSRDDTPMNEERIIWGTYSNTIEKKVEETITSLTSVSSSDFTITKKYPDSVSKRWWFVIAAEEPVLLKLQEEWHLVKAQTHWKLKKAPTDQASSIV